MKEAKTRSRKNNQLKNFSSKTKGPNETAKESFCDLRSNTAMSTLLPPRFVGAL